MIDSEEPIVASKLPSVISMTLTFIKDAESGETSMECMTIFTDGRIRQKCIPVDGRIVRLDFNDPDAFEEVA